MFLTLKYNAAAGYQGPVKIELLKGTGLLNQLHMPGALIHETVQSQLKIHLSSVLGLSNGLCEHLRAFASMRAVCLFLLARAVDKFFLRAVSTLENTDDERL